MNLSNILICIDDGPFSLQVIEAGLALAAKVQEGQSRTGVVLVVNPMARGEVGYTSGDIQTALKQGAEAFLKKALAPYEERNVLPFVVLGLPVHTAILETAVQFGADLLILGSHGHSGLNRVLMGSVSEEVIRHSHLPVFILPEKALQR